MFAGRIVRLCKLGKIKSILLPENLDAKANNFNAYLSKAGTLPYR